MTSYSRELSHFEFLFLAFLYFRQTKTSHPWARNTDHRPRWSVWTTRTSSERAEVTWSVSTLLHLLILFEQHTWIEHVLSFLFFVFMFGYKTEVCGFCRKPVALSEPAIQALNRTYHEGCFQCRSCHVPLAGKQYYNKAGIPLCDDCYQVRRTSDPSPRRITIITISIYSQNLKVQTRVIRCNNGWKEPTRINHISLFLGQSGTVLGVWWHHHRPRDPGSRATVPSFLFHLHNM